MPSRSLSEFVVDVLAFCEQSSDDWPRDLRAYCALIHARYEALKLDIDSVEALRQAKSEWVSATLKRSRLVRVQYHTR